MIWGPIWLSQNGNGRLRSASTHPQGVGDEGEQNNAAALQTRIGRTLANGQPNPERPEQNLEKGQKGDFLRGQVAGSAHHQHARQAQLCHA